MYTQMSRQRSILKEFVITEISRQEKHRRNELTRDLAALYEAGLKLPDDDETSAPAQKRPTSRFNINWKNVARYVAGAILGVGIATNIATKPEEKRAASNIIQTIKNRVPPPTEEIDFSDEVDKGGAFTPEQEEKIKKMIATATTAAAQRAGSDETINPDDVEFPDEKSDEASDIAPDAGTTEPDAGAPDANQSDSGNLPGISDEEKAELSRTSTGAGVLKLAQDPTLKNAEDLLANQPKGSGGGRALKGAEKKAHEQAMEDEFGDFGGAKKKMESKKHLARLKIV